MSPSNDNGSRRSISSETKERVDTASSLDESDSAHLGVKTVEATHKVYGKYSKWALFIRYDSMFRSRCRYISGHFVVLD